MERRSNQYHDIALEELAAALQGRAGELRSRSPRTPAERAALADDTADLLGAAYMAIHPGRHYPGAPENEMDDVAGFAAAFSRWNAALARQGRYRTLVRAASAALGPGHRAWLRDARLGDQRAYELAMASDAGLGRVLEYLEQLRPRR